MDWKVGLVEKELSHHCFGPLLSANLHKLALGLHVVDGILHGPPGQDVGTGQALGVEEGQHHLYALSHLDIGPFRAKQALFRIFFTSASY
jgi:hypothetical protein